jgi:membrane protein
LKRSSIIHKIPGISKLIVKFPIPARVQKIIYNTDTLFGDIDRCDLLKQASAMAYTTLLSIIPSLAAFFSVLTIFTPILGKDSHLMSQAQDFIVSNLAQGTGDQVSGVLNNFISKLDVTKIGISSFAGLLVTLIMLLKQIEAALNRVWLVKKERSMLMRSMYFWTFLTLGGFVIALAAGILSGFNLSSFIPFGEQVKKEGNNPLFKWLLSYMTTLVFFFAVYKVVPNCKVLFKDALIGAVFAAFLFQEAGSGFGYYVQNFSKHQAVYGALAALPLFLSWIYICWVIVLFGSVISWRTQQGFPNKVEEKEDGEKLSSPEVKMREMRLQTMAPFLVLMTVYRSFSSGNGNGISGVELHKELSFPSSWIADSLETLESMQYVVSASSVSGTEVVDYMTGRFFPCKPAEAVMLAKVRADLLEPGVVSIEKWNHKVPDSYIEILKSVSMESADPALATTIAPLLHGYQKAAS